MLDRIAVIGRDDHAAREAILLRAYSPSVILLTLGSDCVLSKPSRDSLEAAGVPLVAVHADGWLVDSNLLHAQRLDGSRLAPFEVVYNALGVDPQSSLAAAIGVSLDSGGCILVDAHL